MNWLTKTILSKNINKHLRVYYRDKKKQLNINKKAISFDGADNVGQYKYVGHGRQKDQFNCIFWERDTDIVFIHVQ